MKLFSEKSIAIRDALCVAAIVGLLVLCGCGNSGPVATVTPDQKSLVAGNNAFALDLYQKLKDQPGNLVFSPFSISIGAAMTYAGARGQTETELATALHFTLPQRNLHPAFSDLAARLDKVQRWNRITLTTANSLWGQQDYPFTPTFLDLVRQQYHAEAKAVDFRDGGSAAAAINSWTEQKTKAKIKSAVESGQLTPDTRLLLCNAIYFQGKWETPFDEKNTQPAPFYLTGQDSITIPTMTRNKGQFKTTQTGDVSLLELPYAGEGLSMIVLLPNAVEGLPDLERELTPAQLSQWLDELAKSSKHELVISLPRFKTTQGFELEVPLKALGVSNLFGAEADLSGMSGDKDLFISDAMHLAFIEVNESGTEAAATTVFKAKTKSMRRSFRANHPFLYLIRENQTGSILFLGRIVDPTK
jgi:serpin B